MTSLTWLKYIQYRMCQEILDLSNALIYGDRLRCGSFEAANAKLEFSGLNCGLPWLEDVRLFSSGFSLSYMWRILHLRLNFVHS